MTKKIIEKKPLAAKRFKPPKNTVQEVEPSRAVRGSTSGRPIMALLDLLGQRWTLRIMWELYQQPQGFRELQTSCDAMSPSVLSRRLEQLRQAEILEPPTDGTYQLSASGQQLLRYLEPLDKWARKWAKRKSIYD